MSPYRREAIKTIKRESAVFNDYNKNYDMDRLIKSMEHHEYRPDSNETQFMDFVKKFKLSPDMFLDQKQVAQLTPDG